VLKRVSARGIRRSWRSDMSEQRRQAAVSQLFSGKRRNGVCAAQTAASRVWLASCRRDMGVFWASMENRLVTSYNKAGAPLEGIVTFVTV